MSVHPGPAMLTCMHDCGSAADAKLAAAHSSATPDMACLNSLVIIVAYCEWVNRERGASGVAVQDKWDNSVRDCGKARHRLERIEVDVVAHIALACIDERLPVP